MSCSFRDADRSVDTCDRLSTLLLGCPGSRGQSGVVPETTPVGKGAFAAGVAGIAAVTYVAAGGCKISGLPGGYGVQLGNGALRTHHLQHLSSPTRVPRTRLAARRTGTCVPF